MEQILGRAERILRAGIGLVIVAIGIYTVAVNLMLGLFVIGVGAFTFFEGVKGWTLIYWLTNRWVTHGGGNLELSGIKPQKKTTEKRD
jgi:Protein of unknown function (DUF2892).